MFVGRVTQILCILSGIFDLIFVSFFHKFWWTCTLSSPGKKLVTRYWSHISTDLSTEKTPPDVTKCHKIKYRNVRRFWSLHTKKIELYRYVPRVQCEKKPGDVWNMRTGTQNCARKSLPRAVNFATCSCSARPFNHAMLVTL